MSRPNACRVISSHTKVKILVGIGTLAMVVVVNLGPWFALNGTGAATPNDLTCKTTALTLEANGEVGLGNASYTIVFRNLGSRTCVLRGYPAVVASLKSKPSVVAPGAAPWPKLEESAQRTQNSQAGGVFGTIEQLRHYLPPTVVLPPGNGVASFTIDWNEEQPNPETKCWTAIHFSISPPEDDTALLLRNGGLLCSEIAVTPIVPGRTGSLHLR